MDRKYGSGMMGAGERMAIIRAAAKIAQIRHLFIRVDKCFSFVFILLLVSLVVCGLAKKLSHDTNDVNRECGTP
jgi:hypothetical protein